MKRVKREALTVSRLIHEVLVGQLSIPFRQIVNDTTFADYPESTEAMGRGVDTRDDGQGKANGASPIPIDGDEGGVR